MEEPEPKPPAASGIVYIFSNPSMVGYIKIGRTAKGTVQSRLKDLNTTGVPMGFDCEYAAEVEDAPSVEKALHEAFGEYRVNPKREFFYRLPPHRVKAILKLVAIEDVTPTQDEPDEELPTVGDKRKKYNFEKLGIPVGAKLQWADDPQIQCEVAGDQKNVLYRDEQWSLGALAGTLKGWKNVWGVPYWMYEGETLLERRNRLEEG